MQLKQKAILFLISVSFISLKVVEDNTWRYLKVSTNPIVENSKIKEIETDSAPGIKIKIIKRTDFIQGFIINNSDSIIEIPQADGSLNYCQTLILKDTVWAELQRINNSEIWCGNSYYSTPLPSKNVLPFRIRPVTEGSVKTRMKIKIKINNTYYFSNEIEVSPSKEHYHVAGNPIAGLYKMYDYYILMADQLFIDNLYSEAKEMYILAHKIYKDEHYASDKIKDCDNHLNK